jgi:hypothetical protein
VSSLVELSLEKVFRRGHGSLYDGLARGHIDSQALRFLLVRSWDPVDAGPVKFAIDVSPWPRPDAETSRQRCHAYASCRCDGSRKTIPGWPYSVAVGLEWGATSWTAPLDAVRIGPDDDATLATVVQIRRVMAALGVARTLVGRPPALAVMDSGYDLTRIAHLLAGSGEKVQVLGRVRSCRVYYGPPGARRGGGPGRQPRHGTRFELDNATTHHDPDEQLSAENPRYGKVQVSAWHGLHQQLAHQGGWTNHTGQLPVVTGTVIRIQVESLPGDRAPKDLWLWHHGPEGTVFDLDLLWKTYLRRFDLEHTFRFLKQHLGWTVPQIRDPEQGDRWTWMILAAYTQLRLASTLTEDLCRAWEKPIPTGQIPTPGRVRRGFAILHRKLGTPARKPIASEPGPGRPKGTTRPPRPRYPVGKNHAKPDTPKKVKLTQG